MKDFFQLLERNQARLCRLARSYSDGSDYDDILQEIYLQLWRSHGTYRGEAGHDTWVFRVALNTAMSCARRRRSERKRVDAVQANASSPAQAEPNEQARLLEDFLGSLNDTNRATLLMYLEGMQTAEIAEVLGCQPQAAATRLSRLKTLFEKRYLEDH